MGDFVLIRPQDDASAVYASAWGDEAVAVLASDGHGVACAVDGDTPADRAAILAALGTACELVCYFGHGDRGAWLTDFAPTIDASTVQAASGKAVISIACHTGRDLGPDAVTAGVVAWLGFTMKVPVFAPHRNRHPIGEQLAQSMAVLGAGGSFDELRAELIARLEELADEFDQGTLRHHPFAEVGYNGCLALASHIAVHGAGGCRPLLP